MYSRFDKNSPNGSHPSSLSRIHSLPCAIASTSNSAYPETVRPNSSYNKHGHEPELTDSTDTDQFNCPLNCTDDESKMRRKLNYFFMNPMEKYRAKGRIPYKLFLQIAKLILVTIQIIIFGYRISGYFNFFERNDVAFKHLYLLGWDSSYETNIYPPNHGPFSVYTYKTFYEAINYAQNQYNNTLNIAVGSYGFADAQPKMTLCKTFYRFGKIYPTNQSYEFNTIIDEECIDLEMVWKDNDTVGEPVLEYDIKYFLKLNNMSINFDRLLYIDLKFSLKSVHINSIENDDSPECYKFNILMRLDNRDHNGQILLSLSSNMVELDCHGSISGSRSTIHLIARTAQTVLDAVVIIFCCVSSLLCFRSFFSGWRTYTKAAKFFKLHYNIQLTKDKCEFFNGWFLVMIFNDILNFTGSICKINLDYRTYCYEENGVKNCLYWRDSQEAIYSYTSCSYLLGLGTLMVWLGVLRYLGFSYKNNILILTIKTALPNVIRFFACSLVIYLAFSFCAWVILGPYHIKFRSFFTTLECLFAMINGDDIFNTFANTSNAPVFVAIFIRVYIYAFCTLFIYVVVNLFLTLILEAYKEIKSLKSTQGRSDTPLWRFIRQCPENSFSPLYRHDDMEDMSSTWSLRKLAVNKTDRMKKWLAARRKKIYEDNKISDLPRPQTNIQGDEVCHLA